MKAGVFGMGDGVQHTKKGNSYTTKYNSSATDGFLIILHKFM